VENTTLHLCSTRTLPGEAVVVTSHTPSPLPRPLYHHFHDLLLSWTNHYWWDDLKYTGDGTWIYSAIENGSLMCVSDGSYIRELHTDVCSAAIILECSQGRGRLSLSILDVAPTVNAFRGELLGLMAVHLLLYSLHKTRPTLVGEVRIYSDCTGALKTVSSLPPARTPLTWKHADVLKLIALYGKDFPFASSYHHVKAHQDDTVDWDKLSRPSQLNCACDAAAKKRILEFLPHSHPQRPFPCEPLMMIVENTKTTSDTDSILRFTAHKQEARELFARLHIMTPDQFDEVSWQDVHATLHKLPKMFQLFTGKQVFGVSAVLANLSKQKEFSHLGDKCPSCLMSKETTSHILYCREFGRVRCLNMMIHRITQWLESVGTTPELTDLLSDFLRSRGSMLHEGHQTHLPTQYTNFLRSQELIGWQTTMEGMISKELLMLAHSEVLHSSSRISQEEWARGLICKLFEATHGIWIYRNMTMHDKISGLVATKGKEQLLQEIELQIERGGEGLAEHDKWMLEIDLDRLENSSGERESYWLLAIQTARAHYHLVNPQLEA